MYDLLARMYRLGQIDTAGLDVAVARGWIAEEQKAAIVDADGNIGAL